MNWEECALAVARGIATLARNDGLRCTSADCYSGEHMVVINVPIWDDLGRDHTFRRTLSRTQIEALIITPEQLAATMWDMAKKESWHK